jgi:hypothetical protein
VKTIAAFFAISLSLFIALVVHGEALPGQHPSHTVGGGHVPAHGPAPIRANHGPTPEHPNFADKTGHPNAPHVHTNDKWIGHDTGRGDPTII